MSDKPDTAIWRALEIAEDNAEDADVSFHIRQAMSVHQAKLEVEA